jgi:hypothetical protein
MLYFLMKSRRSINHGHSQSLTDDMPDVGKAGSRGARLIRGEQKVLQFRPMRARIAFKAPS